MINARQLILSIIGRHRRLVMFTLIALFLSNLLNVLLPLSIGVFYELAFHQQSIKGALLKRVLPIPEDVASFFGFFMLLVLAKGGLHFLEKYWTGRLGELLGAQLRERAFKAQMRQTMKAHLEKATGKYLLRFSGDLNAIREFINRGILVFAGDVFFLICAFTGLIMLNPEAGWIVLACWSLAALLVYWLSRRLRVATLDRRGQRSRGLAFVSERLQAFYTVKSFNRETPETESYRRESRRLLRLGLRFFRITAFLQALSPVLFFGVLALVLWRAVHAEDAATTQGNLFAFVLLLLHMHTVLQRMLEVNLVWQSGSASLSKLLALMNKPRESRARTADGFADEDAGIVLQEVRFTYPGAQTGLPTCSANFPANALTLLKGRSGSGKTTLFKLLQKLYEPDSGEIFVNGTSLRSCSPFALRREVSVVSADAPLMGKTVLSAIAYTESPEHREAAAALLQKLRFNIGDTIDATLDFRIGEQGRKLSSGQIAMLQVARALLTEKKIILLDEPFVRLDTRQTARVVRLLNKLKGKHTLVLICRRPPTRLEIDHTISLDTHDTEADAAEGAADD